MQKNVNASGSRVESVERIVAFFAARGIRHVIVVPEAAAGNDSDLLESGPSVQPSNRVGDSIIALIEQEDKSTGTSADDLHVTKSNSLVVVSARPCLMKRAVRAGAKIMLPRALKRMVRGADTTSPTALTPVLLSKEANATTKPAFAASASASTSAEAALMSDQDAEDAEDDLLEAAVGAIGFDGPADEAANDGHGDEDHDDHDLAIALAFAQGLDDDEEGDFEMIADASEH